MAPGQYRDIPELLRRRPGRVLETVADEVGAEWARRLWAEALAEVYVAKTIDQRSFAIGKELLNRWYPGHVLAPTIPVLLQALGFDHDKAIRYGLRVLEQLGLITRKRTQGSIRIVFLHLPLPADLHEAIAQEHSHPEKGYCIERLEEGLMHRKIEIRNESRAPMREVLAAVADVMDDGRVDATSYRYHTHFPSFQIWAFDGGVLDRFIVTDPGIAPIDPVRRWPYVRKGYAEQQQRKTPKELPSMDG